MPECLKAIARAGSRIHLGFHTVPHAKQAWAGAGIYLDAHHTIVEATPSKDTRINPPILKPTIQPALEANNLQNITVTIHRHAPRHQGLGSTTQLTLAALSAAYTVKHGKPPTKNWLHQAARKAGRGKNGWVGTLLYTHGGFIACTGEPVPLHHTPLPTNWRIILVRPVLPSGMDERREQNIMNQLSPAPDRLLARMQRGLYDMLLGLSLGDVDIFSQGLLKMQNATGEYFSQLQGGTYRSDLARIVDEAYRDGIILGQSSWGPTLYTVTTVDRAESDAKTLRMITRILGIRSSIEIVNPLNMPATVSCERTAHT